VSISASTVTSQVESLVLATPIMDIFVASHADPVTADGPWNQSSRHISPASRGSVRGSQPDDLRARARITSTAVPIVTCDNSHVIVQVVHARALIAERTTRAARPRPTIEQCNSASWTEFLESRPFVGHETNCIPIENIVDRSRALREVGFFRSVGF
jgi:hypothetical protein